MANLPEIGYGNMRPGARRVVARTLFRLADAVVCVSEAAAEEAVVNGKVPRSRVRVVYNAFDSEAIGAEAVPSAKEAMVLTVAGVDATTLMRKGLLTVARTSRLMPDVPFVIAGRCTPEAGARLVAEGGSNLTVAGFLPDDERLERLFGRARVYYQPSSHEAFGCWVAEAMLHDCLPVVSDRFALPEVVGPCGLYVPADDPAAAVPALRRALACDVDFPEQPRARIKRQFPSHRRGEELAGILDQPDAPGGEGLSLARLHDHHRLECRADGRDRALARARFVRRPGNGVARPRRRHRLRRRLALALAVTGSSLAGPSELVDTAAECRASSICWA